MGKRLIPVEPAEIHEVQLRDALEERYLAYALSTIMHRALPDARDGLKPVHRRILYGMRLLRLDPGSAFKKSAKIVGDVMGSFHPHGDQAIYDAMVRLAQDFASRYPLVDGQGNFGNIDGDNPAAYRYTEARMTDVARLLLDGIDEDAVEFRPNYDGHGHPVKCRLRDYSPQGGGVLDHPLSRLMTTSPAWRACDSGPIRALSPHSAGVNPSAWEND